MAGVSDDRIDKYARICYDMISPQGGYLDEWKGRKKDMCQGHRHEETKNVLNRISRVIGHLESVKRMIEEGRDCSDVLIQLAAVRSAINSAGQVLLKDHMEHCMQEALQTGDKQALDRLNRAIELFIR